MVVGGAGWKPARWSKETRSVLPRSLRCSGHGARRVVKGDTLTVLLCPRSETVQALAAFCKGWGVRTFRKDMCLARVATDTSSKNLFSQDMCSAKKQPRTRRAKQLFPSRYVFGQSGQGLVEQKHFFRQDMCWATVATDT